MRIGIEAQRIFRRNKHGMDYVVLEEVRQLQTMDTQHEFFVYVAPGEDVCLRESANVHIRTLRMPSYPLWEQVALPRAAHHDGVELLHCTSNTAPIHCSIPLVLTLHDIIFLEPRDKRNTSLYQNAGWAYRRLVVPRVLSKCRRIITVSDFERQNIISHLGLPETQVVRIYNGYNEHFKCDSEQREDKDCDVAPFFFLGNTDPKKNTERTLIAYATYLRKSSVKRRLIVADLSKEYIDSMLTKCSIADVSPFIDAPGYIANSELPAVYRSAFAFLYTSLRESFGIPLLEAMACGTPVITSRTSSMPEIAGCEAALVNPEDTDDIAAMMLRLETDAPFYATQRALGLERVTLFSWRTTATALLHLYEQLLPRSRR